MYVCVRVCVFVCVFVCLCVCMFVCLCLCVQGRKLIVALLFRETWILDKTIKGNPPTCFFLNFGVSPPPQYQKLKYPCNLIFVSGPCIVSSSHCHFMPKYEYFLAWTCNTLLKWFLDMKRTNDIWPEITNSPKIKPEIMLIV